MSSTANDDELARSHRPWFVLTVVVLVAGLGAFLLGFAGAIPFGEGFASLLLVVPLLFVIDVLQRQSLEEEFKRLIRDPTWAAGDVRPREALGTPGSSQPAPARTPRRSPRPRSPRRTRPPPLPNRAGTVRGDRHLVVRRRRIAGHEGVQLAGLVAALLDRHATHGTDAGRPRAAQVGRAQLFVTATRSMLPVA